MHVIKYSIQMHKMLAMEVHPNIGNGCDDVHSDAVSHGICSEISAAFYSKIGYGCKNKSEREGKKERKWIHEFSTKYHS